jgi:hypothetical protein
VAILLAGLWIWLHRPPFTATRAYRRLRASLGSRSDEPLGPSVPPLAVGRLLAARWPGAAVSGLRVIDLYLRESFGGQPLADGERESLEHDLRETLSGLRESAR